ncbi:uncharacterized protein BJ171DRAFT_520212 [Polychytrium aggregatum]|uniref:uncharacterized protein n=1 Tax=Polychytrium aggregatum TaxID=110093 RepID=UPI0022FEF754|nr:uncharacterized protein BJ171DRAFT_520212 [Polychytrium aggregatum]KAI9197414.1 hypothetical protein BJ171DRAFT_520212 [Polychytrium aggregatum]
MLARNFPIALLCALVVLLARTAVAVDPRGCQDCPLGYVCIDNKCVLVPEGGTSLLSSAVTAKTRPASSSSSSSIAPSLTSAPSSTPTVVSSTSVAASPSSSPKSSASSHSQSVVKALGLSLAVGLAGLVLGLF